MPTQITAAELRPGDTIPHVGRVNTITLTRHSVTILFDPIAAPPGTTLAPDHLVWITRVPAGAQ